MPPNAFKVTYAIVQCLDLATGEVRVDPATIAGDAALSIPTVRKMLKLLTAQGHLRASDDGRYRLVD